MNDPGTPPVQHTDGYGNLELNASPDTAFRYYPEDGALDVIVEGKHLGRLSPRQTATLTRWLAHVETMRAERKDDRR